MKRMDDYMLDTVRAAITRSPKTQKELEAQTGIDRRYIKQAIRDLRLEGLPICSGNEGYWMARSEEELASTKRRLWHEIRERLALANAMSGHPLDGQLTFEDYKVAFRQEVSE